MHGTPALGRGRGWVQAGVQSSTSISVKTVSSEYQPGVTRVKTVDAINFCCYVQNGASGDRIKKVIGVEFVASVIDKSSINIEGKDAGQLQLQSDLCVMRACWSILNCLPPHPQGFPINLCTGGHPECLTSHPAPGHTARQSRGGSSGSWCRPEGYPPCGKMCW
mgnify:CR=1 FL=1